MRLLILATVAVRAVYYALCLQPTVYVELYVQCAFACILYICTCLCVCVENVLVNDLRQCSQSVTLTICRYWHITHLVKHRQMNHLVGFQTQTSPQTSCQPLQFRCCCFLHESLWSNPEVNSCFQWFMQHRVSVKLVDRSKSTLVKKPLSVNSMHS